MSSEPVSPPAVESEPQTSSTPGPDEASPPPPTGQLRTPLPHPSGDDDGEVVFAPAELIARALERSDR